MTTETIERGSYFVCRTPGKPGDDWYHILPRGVYEVDAMIEGKSKDVTLVADDEAFRRILEQFREDAAADNWEGYLVGKEHFSHMADQSSEAQAWCLDLEVRGDGLWGRFEKTALGEQSIGSIYKYRSPVGDLERIEGRRWRPVSIVDIGLTNKPKFKNLASAKGRAGQQQKEVAMLDRMRAILAMPDATEDQVLARAQKAVQAEKELETTKQTLVEVQGTVLAREADVFIEANKARIEDSDEGRAKIKARYIADAEGTKAIFEGLRVQSGGRDGQRVLGRETARTPATTVLGAGGDEQTVADTARAARVSARAKELINSGVCATLSQGYAHAEQEIASE